ncbi:hypothetical protein GQ43DRAFT_481231 [Delitschia confertaspora ATCC 74209]|uniref:BTB domain-containing protein n=1 Tax=Delitschia confertaspora ATCC 74209 TaxID=1513339 RepID=A0A9P4MSB6_9PLEO|nr:hypothetical protein GQ43DRAFT_481231 [Delitschia confertaspora ATCC 74209]
MEIRGIQKTLAIPPKMVGKRKRTGAKGPPPKISKLADSIVTITVGPSKKSFLIHQNLLTYHSDYFRGCFSGSFSEAQSRTLNLPDVSVPVFETFVDWLYSGTLGLADFEFRPLDNEELYWCEERGLGADRAWKVPQGELVRGKVEDVAVPPDRADDGEDNEDDSSESSCSSDDESSTEIGESLPTVFSLSRPRENDSDSDDSDSDPDHSSCGCLDYVDEDHRLTDRLIETYIFADAHDVPQLRRVAMDALFHHVMMESASTPSYKTIARAFPRLPGSSPMARFLVDVESRLGYIGHCDDPSELEQVLGHKSQGHLWDDDPRALRRREREVKKRECLPFEFVVAVMVRHAHIMGLLRDGSRNLEYTLHACDYHTHTDVEERDGCETLEREVSWDDGDEDEYDEDEDDEE